MDRLGKAYQTLLEMLVDRGYKALNGGELTKEVIEEGRVRTGRLRTGGSTRSTLSAEVQVCLIRTLDYDKVTTEAVSAIRQHMEEAEPTDSLNHGIFIHRGKVITQAKIPLRDLRNQGFRIELFSVDELQYNPARHVLVPHHTIVSAAEKEEVLRAYCASSRKTDLFPSIKSTDVMVRYLGARKGNVIRVDRESPTLVGETAPYYRIVA